MRQKCRIGYIYSLMFNNKPFYIGQTKKSIYERIKGHYRDAFINKKYSDIYKYIRSISNSDNFYLLIKIKPLIICDIYDLRHNEIKCIKYCIDRNVKIYNSCVVTNTLLIDKQKKSSSF